MINKDKMATLSVCHNLWSRGLEQGLVQRLIGAVVLLAMLIALAPALFRGGDTHPLAHNSESTDLAIAGGHEQGSVSIPAASGIEKPPPVPDFVENLNIPSDPVDVEQDSSEREVFSDAEAMLAKEGKAAGVDANGHFKAWALQVATFSNRKNAYELEKRLNGMGYSSYVKKVIGSGGRYFYRVCIGPEVRTEDLHVAMVKIEKELDLEGVIIRFVP